MTVVFVTGMSGTGKSALIEALDAHGCQAVDTDSPAYSHMVEAGPDELTGLGAGLDWVWREDRIDALLAAAGDDVLFISGCSPNQARFYPNFDRIVLLTAPAEVIAERLATRTSNAFGKDQGELERTLALQTLIEPALRRSASLVIDTRSPLSEVVAQVLRHAGFERSTRGDAERRHKTSRDRARLYADVAQARLARDQQ